MIRRYAYRAIVQGAFAIQRSHPFCRVYRGHRCACLVQSQVVQAGGKRQVETVRSVPYLRLWEVCILVHLSFARSSRGSSLACCPVRASCGGKARGRQYFAEGRGRERVFKDRKRSWRRSCWLWLELWFVKKLGLVLGCALMQEEPGVESLYGMG